jgi:hypothetical protein
MVSPGTAFYIGYNEGRENFAILRLGPPQLYRQGAPEFLTGRQFFVKLNYLLRF